MSRQGKNQPQSEWVSGNSKTRPLSLDPEDRQEAHPESSCRSTQGDQERTGEEGQRKKEGQEEAHGQKAKSQETQETSNLKNGAKRATEICPLPEL